MALHRPRGHRDRRQLLQCRVQPYRWDLCCLCADTARKQTLSNQAVVIVLPTIGSDLDIPYSRQQWIVSAYSLTFGCFLLLWGRIGDVFDKKTIFVAGSVWVTIMTVANPFVHNEILFDLFRGLQGLVRRLYFSVYSFSVVLTLAGSRC